MAREVFETNWIKLELIGDDDTLQPDVFQLVEAAEILIKDGFKVLPYCTEVTSSWVRTRWLFGPVSRPGPSVASHPGVPSESTV